jgi:hypothetical protein
MGLAMSGWWLRRTAALTPSTHGREVDWSTWGVAEAAVIDYVGRSGRRADKILANEGLGMCRRTAKRHQAPGVDSQRAPVRVRAEYEFDKLHL